MIPITSTDAGVRFAAYIQPRASRTEVSGVHGDAVKIRVAAPPVEGAANDALVRFLAKRLRIAASSIRLVGGEHSRRKVVEVGGVGGEALLEALVGRSG
jgi:uncharacterized protein (TIGR00251 family)